MNWVWKLNGFAPEGAGAPELWALVSSVEELVSSAMVKAKVGVGGRR